MRKTPGARDATFDRVILFATIALAVAVASVWAARVPFFQQPDERAHADYAFELADVGRPFAVPHAVWGEAVTPEAKYLSEATQYRANRYATNVRMPPGYGSRRYFSALDHAAPAPVSVIPNAGAALPFLMFSYPIGYYTVAAIAIHLAAFADPGSITARFYAARSIGVLCLIGTMLMANRIFMRLRMPRATARLATVAIGLLPLTSWVSGYIQPDVLTTLLLTASIAASLRWKEQSHAATAAIGLSVSLVLLAFVKEHYAIAAIAATLLAALCSRDAIRRPWVIAATFLPPLCALYAGTHVSPVGAIAPPNLGVYSVTGTTSLQRVSDFATFALFGLRDVFGGGDAFNDYWLRFGYHPGGSIFPRAFNPVVHGVLVAASLTTFALFITSRRFVLGRLLKIARSRSLLLAIRLFAGDAVVNVYTFVTSILLAVYAFSNGFVWLEGRYWLPVIVPTLAIVTLRNVRLFKPAIRRRLSLGFASTWAAYALIGAPLGIAAIQRSFYSDEKPSTHEAFSQILRVVSEPACTKGGVEPELGVRAGCVVHVTGFAIDGSRGLPATDVFLTVDGVRAARASIGRPTPHLVTVYNDQELARAGFDAELQTRTLSPGRHELGITIVESGAPRERLGSNTVSLDVLR
jgi:4-amino-4-deoxy-L-arabinose transferase-like glycosyltransferase